MFTQFRVRYPKGCLISEFVTIDHGKYVVRALVKVEDVTLATGLAAAETVELAEDRARTRALAVLGIHPTTANNDVSANNAASMPSGSNSTGASLLVPAELTAPSAGVAPRFVPSTMETSPVSGEVSAPGLGVNALSQPAFSSEQLNRGDRNPIFSETFGIDKDAAGLSSKEQKFPDVASSTPPLSWEDNTIPFGDDFSSGELDVPEETDVYEMQTPPVTPPKSIFGEPPFSTERKENQGMSEGPINRPLTSASTFSFGQTQTNTGETPAIPDPLDIPDIINRTDVEMKRLGWTKEQGRDYLIKTYGKRARTQLSDVQLLDFLHYLEAQPSPEYE
jgi:hypothetical protein